MAFLVKFLEMLGLLKLEQKQAVGVLLLGRDVVATVPTLVQTSVNTSVFWRFRH